MLSLKENAAVGLVITAFVGGTIFMILAFREPPDVLRHATNLPQSVALPQFKLLDHEGQEFNRMSFSGHWSLVFFGFSNCPDICPATLKQLEIARRRVLAEGEVGPRDGAGVRAAAYQMA